MTLVKVRMRVCKVRVIAMYKLAWLKVSALVLLYKPLLQPGNNQGSGTKCKSLSCQYSPVQASLMHSGHGSHALVDNYSCGVWDHMSWTEITM